MARAGIDAQGRPPIWALRTPVTVGDAEDLHGEYGLRQGFATVEFTAPAALCLASGYGAWNEFQWQVHSRGAEPVEWHTPRLVEGQLVQVCLPELRREWVREVRPLPRRLTGADDRLRPA